MILLLGGSGYVGSAFTEFLVRNDIRFRSVSRTEYQYHNAAVLQKLLQSSRTEFLINCAGYTGKPNVDACELHRGECFAANVKLPQTIRDACEQYDIPWGHVSSGCIFTGCKADGQGFTENDQPNFSFESGNCSYYSGCKALGERHLHEASKTFIWRLRIPFNHADSQRNYLSKLMRYPRLLDAVNSISNLDEFVSACWQSWSSRIPFGTYNVTNSGAVTTREVTELIRKRFGKHLSFDFFRDEDEFMRLAAKTPRSNCTLNNEKLLSAGISMSEATHSIERALDNWQPESLARRAA